MAILQVYVCFLQYGHLPKKTELRLTYAPQILLKPTLVMSNECLLNEIHLGSVKALND